MTFVDKVLGSKLKESFLEIRAAPPFMETVSLLAKIVT